MDASELHKVRGRDTNAREPDRIAEAWHFRASGLTHDAMRRPGPITKPALRADSPAGPSDARAREVDFQPMLGRADREVSGPRCIGADHPNRPCDGDDTCVSKAIQASGTYHTQQSLGHQQLERGTECDIRPPFAPLLQQHEVRWQPWAHRGISAAAGAGWRFAKYHWLDLLIV